MKRIAFLSFVAALGGILLGYDTAVISGTIASVDVSVRRWALLPEARAPVVETHTFK